MIVLDVVGWIMLVAGSVFCMIGGLGLLRLPNFYNRTHGASITDTLGAGLILLGLMFQESPGQVKLKLAMILLFLLITAPTSGHALVKAAYAKGHKSEAKEVK